MDTLDINDVHYDRKILDLQRRYDEQYDTIEEIEVQIGELQSQIRNIQQEKISGDNIYRLLLAFDEVYHSATEAEQKEFMKAFIERIEMFPEKRKDGSWIKKIVFNFPVPVDGEEVKELPLETETTVETVVLLRVFEAIQLVYYLDEGVLNTILGIGAVPEDIVRDKIQLFGIPVEDRFNKQPVIFIFDSHNDCQHTISPPTFFNIISSCRRLVKAKTG